MKIAFHTLGCKVNQTDTINLMTLFKENGYEIVPFDRQADIYVVNTCAVTQIGERKSRQMIRKAIQENPEAIVVVTGCYAQTSPLELADIPGVNLVVGMADRMRIVDLVEEFRSTHRNLVRVTELRGRTWDDQPLGESAERTRITLKIEEGCEQFCSYCIVPYARGPVHSMPQEQVLKKLQLLLDKGYQEIVLTGIHLGSYGKDLNYDLNALLKQIITMEGSFRIRLGSIDPHEFSPELIKTIVNNSRICQHLHIPLQSGSDRILNLMNRRYSLEQYSELLSILRDYNPLIAIGTDLIVGFPGETEYDFADIVAFVQRQKFSRIHVFRYSPRKGTPASQLSGRVPGPEQERRSHMIQEIVAQSSYQFAEKFIGRHVDVLFEERVATEWIGLSSEYLRVKVESNSDLKNNLVPVKIIAHFQDQLQGIY